MIQRLGMDSQSVQPLFDIARLFCTTTCGWRNPGPEPMGLPRSIQKISPREITFPLSRSVDVADASRPESFAPWHPANRRKRRSIGPKAAGSHDFERTLREPEQKAGCAKDAFCGRGLLLVQIDFAGGRQQYLIVSGIITFDHTGIPTLGIHRLPRPRPRWPLRCGFAAST